MASILGLAKYRFDRFAGADGEEPTFLVGNRGARIDAKTMENGGGEIGRADRIGRWISRRAIG
jgi:hypothetical protein